MRTASRLLGGLDEAVARVEAALLCLLLAWLCAGGVAQVALQNAPDMSGGAARVLVGAAGALLLVAGVAQRVRGRAEAGGRCALLGLFLALVCVGLWLDTAADRVLRAAVLWIALVGGSLATRHREHITIEALDKVLPAHAKRWTEVVVAACALAILTTLVVVSLEWVGDGRERGEVFQRIGEREVPEWWVQAVLPVGFALMGWRFALILLEGLTGVRILPAKRPAPGAEDLVADDPEAPAP